MQKYADYIKQIEIDALWSGRKHIIWDLDRQVNILSGVNGVGKSTILNKVVKGLSSGGDFPSHLLKGVHLKVEPEDARLIRFDIIRSFDRPIINSEAVTKMGLTLATEMDWQIFLLQRKYLDYQVNIGNRIIATLQSGEPDAAEKAQALSQPKKDFQDIMDSLFAETGKKIIRTENEIKFTQIGETLLPYQLSSGEKQILVILLHGRARGEPARGMAEATHRPHPPPQPQRADHPHYPLPRRDHERMDGQGHRGQRHHGKLRKLRVES